MYYYGNIYLSRIRCIRECVKKSEQDKNTHTRHESNQLFDYELLLIHFLRPDNKFNSMGNFMIFSAKLFT